MMKRETLTANTTQLAFKNISAPIATPIATASLSEGKSFNLYALDAKNKLYDNGNKLQSSALFPSVEYKANTRNTGSM